MSKVGFSGGSSGSGSTTPLDTRTIRDKLFDSLDLRTVYLWFDPTTALERIKSITYASSTLQAVAKKSFLYDDDYVLLGNVWSYPNKTASATVGAGGGVVNGSDDVSSITIPNTALVAPVIITVTVTDSSSIAIDNLGNNLVSVTSFGPSGTVFSVSATLEFPLKKPEPPGAVYTCYILDGGFWVNSGSIVISQDGLSATATTTRL